jgi:HAD superfamily hydrolase (TIGR01509 family)
VQAVIFDSDGTLADSEPLCEIAWTHTLIPWRYRPTEQDFRTCRGMSYADSRDHFASRAIGLPRAEQLYPRYWTELKQLYRQHLRAFPDALDVLTELRRLLPVAVASSSYRERLDVTLDAINIHGLPSVAGDEVPTAKPAPDLFLAAAELLSTTPEKCLVIEDTQAGINAARAAGMKILAVDRAGDPLSGYTQLTSRLTVEDVSHLLAGH